MIKKALRVGGLVAFATGAVLFAIGLASFFSAFGGGGPPTLFWCALVGMPLVFAGVAMLQFGFVGAALRYLVGESAPVAKDAANYMAAETKDAVKAVAQAVGEGLEEGRKKAGGSDSSKP
jgi:hypothetical protein